MNLLISLALLFGSIQPISNSPFVLNLSVSPTQVHLGDKILLHVLLTNQTEKPVTVAKANGPAQANFNYSIGVIGPSGKILSPRTPLEPANRHAPKAVWSNVGYPIPPGGELEDDVDLGTLYSFDKSGTYRITVSRDFVIDGRTVRVSQRLSLTVQPKM
jgi:hypothetical protein